MGWCMRAMMGHNGTMVVPHATEHHDAMFSDMTSLTPLHCIDNQIRLHDSCTAAILAPQPTLSHPNCSAMGSTAVEMFDLSA